MIQIVNRLHAHAHEHAGQGCWETLKLKFTALPPLLTHSPLIPTPAPFPCRDTWTSTDLCSFRAPFLSSNPAGDQPLKRSASQAQSPAIIRHRPRSPLPPHPSPLPLPHTPHPTPHPTHHPTPHPTPQAPSFSPQTPPAPCSPRPVNPRMHSHNLLASHTPLSAP